MSAICRPARKRSANPSPRATRWPARVVTRRHANERRRQKPATKKSSVRQPRRRAGHPGRTSADRVEAQVQRHPAGGGPGAGQSLAEKICPCAASPASSSANLRISRRSSTGSSASPASRPGRGWDPSTAHRRGRPDPPGHHRPVRRRSARSPTRMVDRSRAQRRGLQLPGAATRPLRPRAPAVERLRHRGDRPPGRGTGSGRGGATPGRHVRLRRVGQRRRRLVFGRDRLGKKPLYYSDGEGRSSSAARSRRSSPIPPCRGGWTPTRSPPT